MKDFFISYNQADKAWAEWIAWKLEEASFTSIIQAWDFRPGQNFVLEMQKAAIEAQRVLAVLSPHYLDALYTQPEWAVAFAQDPAGKTRSLLPVRVRECELKGLLAQIIYIDLVGLDESAATATLVQGIDQQERIKPAIPPAFPENPGPRFPPSASLANAIKKEMTLPQQNDRNITIHGNVSGVVINQGALSGAVDISMQPPKGCTTDQE
ncbi:MAG: toll/interleukin-1 receptor domain-containing protein [Methylococcales bacterium]